ncbi:MAG: radical SAM family heme chaperone HemW [Lachnospiraceae bacterium]
MNNKALKLYLHIPFCAMKCAYCDFLSFRAPEKTYREYSEKLVEEIYGQSSAFADRQVTSLFIGGGTPSIMPARLMSELLSVLHNSFNFIENAEVTIEANPGTLTMEKLETYLEGSVNRISLGLQSADDNELRSLGRIHSYDEFLKSYQRARQAGFTNINIDLMSGLPGQTVQSWKHTLRKVLMLKPEHISAYGLIIEEGTPFYERYHPHPEELPDEETDREMYRLTRTILEEQGYIRYEISNYAKPGYECRHNIGYWTGADYLGLGLGSSSYINNHRFHNTSDRCEYMALNLLEPNAASRDIQELTHKEKMEEFMFLGLRMMQGISGSEFMGRFGENMWNVYGAIIERLEQQGLVAVESPFIRLTEMGIDVSNYVMSEFLLG